MNGEKLVGLAEGHVTALRTLLPEINAASQAENSDVSRDQYSRLFLNVRGLATDVTAETEEVEVEEHDEKTGAKVKVKKIVPKKAAKK